MTKQMKTLTVAELIEVLQEQDQDALVIFAADYGDYHHTEQALPLRGEAEEVTISESAYSNSGFQIDSDDEGYDDEPSDDAVEAQTYVVIR